MESRPVDNIVKKITLGGNIQTIFWLYLALLLVSLAEVLTIEVRIFSTVWFILRMVSQIRFIYIRDYVFR